MQVTLEVFGDHCYYIHPSSITGVLYGHQYTQLHTTKTNLGPPEKPGLAVLSVKGTSCVWLPKINFLFSAQ